MCPSSWKLYVDDFPFFFGSSLACLEPKLELFDVDAIGDDDDLSHVYLTINGHFSRPAQTDPYGIMR